MKQILNNLFQHKTLTRDSSKEILMKIAAGEYNQSQMAAFLTVFQLRNITVEELQGFRDALLEMGLRIDLNGLETIDLCGTGGDGKNTFNISTLASFVVAGAGVPVTKHGNYGVSSSCGSSNILEHLGYKFTNSADKIMKQLETAGICYLHAPLFNPAMKTIAPIRRELAIKTFFNMLGPMVSPVSPKNQLIGVFNLELARIYNYVYQESGCNYTIVHSLDGYDEVSLTGDFRIQSRGVEANRQPEYFGFSRYNPVELAGGSTVEESAKIFLSVLEGKGTKAQEDVVVANAGLALNTRFPEKNHGECFEMARESIKAGKALGCLKNLISISE